MRLSLKDWCIENNKEELLSEWDYDKNGELTPEQCAWGTEKIAYWKCGLGHKYQMSVYDRTKAKKCPICSGKRILKGYNDLLTTHPDITKEWDYERNTEIFPDNVSYGSNKKVWWKCEKGHSWEAVISSRTIGNKSGCPICSGNEVLEGYNDLATTHPELARQWSEKNELSASHVSRGSRYKAIWICENKHEYKATVYSRVNMKSGCPICAKALQTSFPEKAICYYLKLCFSDLIENYRPKWIGKSELDIYIPSLNLAVEYDSGAWHRNVEKDLKKDKLCNDNSITLIRIRDYRCKPLNDTTSIQFFVKDKGWEELSRSILEIYTFINQKYGEVKVPSIDIERDKSKIYELMDIVEKRDSLFDEYPDVAKEWNSEKNGYLTAKMITSRVGKKVWWKCKYGHEWQATVASRTDQNIGCPYCSGRYAVLGETDLATTHPDVAKEWHPTKNGELTPDKVKAGTNKKVWWMCSFGHEYEASPASRTSMKKCPICSGRRVLAGVNDLQAKYPEIAKQWHPKLNGDFKPIEVTPKSDKKVWWVCDKGHEWQAQVKHRTNGTGCPICAGKKK